MFVLFRFVRGFLRSQSTRFGVGREVYRRFRVLETIHATNELVAFGVAQREEFRCGHARRLALVSGTFLRVFELVRADNRGVGVALTDESTRAGGWTAEPVVVGPALCLKTAQKLHPGETRGSAVGGVGGDLPAPVTLADLLFADPLPSLVVDD